MGINYIYHDPTNTFIVLKFLVEINKSILKEKVIILIMSYFLLEYLTIDLSFLLHLLRESYNLYYPNFKYQ